MITKILLFTSDVQNDNEIINNIRQTGIANEIVDVSTAAGAAIVASSKHRSMITLDRLPRLVIEINNSIALSKYYSDRATITNIQNIIKQINDIEAYNADLSNRQFKAYKNIAIGAGAFVLLISMIYVSNNNKK